MKKTFRNTAFLVELLINVLVFSISCAILVGVFAKASTLARDTREENYAAAEIHSMFEIAKARGTGEVVAEGVTGSQAATYYYDRGWNLAEQDAAEYRITLQVEQEDTSSGQLNHILALAEHRSGRLICTLETALYEQMKGGAANG